MAMSVSSATVREAIAETLVEAWNAQKIFFSASQLPLSDADFAAVNSSNIAAKAFVILDEVTPEPVQGQAGFGQAQLAFRFRIVGQFKFPAPDSGDILQDVKETNADALLAELTASPVYADGRREVLAVRYNDVAATEQYRGHFEVEIEFQWRGTTGG